MPGLPAATPPMVTPSPMARYTSPRTSAAHHVDFMGVDCPRRQPPPVATPGGRPTRRRLPRVGQLPRRSAGQRADLTGQVRLVGVTGPGGDLGRGHSGPQQGQRRRGSAAPGAAPTGRSRTSPGSAGAASGWSSPARRRSRRPSRRAARGPRPRAHPVPVGEPGSASARSSSTSAGGAPSSSRAVARRASAGCQLGQRDPLVAQRGGGHARAGPGVGQARSAARPRAARPVGGTGAGRCPDRRRAARRRSTAGPCSRRAGCRRSPPPRRRETRSTIRTRPARAAAPARGTRGSPRRHG